MHFSDRSRIYQNLPHAVPARFRLLNLDLVFTTREHGHNLNTLYEKCGDEEPLLLIVETLEGHVFGAFLTTAMSQRDSKKYHGQGEVFVFSLKPKAAQYKWCIKEDEDADSSFIMGAIDYFSVGAGGEGNAIWLNYDLTMTASSRSATFENEPLCGESKRTFQVGCVEVYRFTDG
ncbi:TLD-domain-containing protein [Rozella allomycis CSF55]|uniref:TLD-domain-containing protein n=1 Tax=Rozella allomycis (strain CSF55) TaxID=988480 RepID=A0A4P9YRJ5_ROZAC|nr:TLD-domain-containing protein [Rozella allomycis CSF55]